MRFLTHLYIVTHYVERGVLHTKIVIVIMGTGKGMSVIEYDTMLFVNFNTHN